MADDLFPLKRAALVVATSARTGGLGGDQRSDGASKTAGSQFLLKGSDMRTLRVVPAMVLLIFAGRVAGRTIDDAHAEAKMSALAEAMDREISGLEKQFVALAEAMRCQPLRLRQTRGQRLRMTGAPCMYMDLVRQAASASTRCIFGRIDWPVLKVSFLCLE